MERLLADRMAVSFWRLKRVGKIEVELLNNMSSFQLCRPSGGNSSVIPTMRLTKTYEDGSTEIVTSGGPLEKDGAGEDESCELSLGQAVHADFSGSNTLGKFRRYESHID